MTRRNLTALLLLFVFLYSTGCQAAPVPSASPTSTPAPAPSATPAPTPTPTPDPVKEALAAMTDEEKVGQLLIAGFYETQAGEEARRYIQDCHVGGLILYGRNVESAQQLTDLTNGLKALAGDAPIKFTIPSPSMLHLICCVREENYEAIDLYKGNDDKLFADIAQTWKDAMLALYAKGCRYLQFDDTSWGEFCSQEKRSAYAARGIDVDTIGRKYVACINEILEAKPEDMTVTMHICRGNFRSTWFSSGGYEPVAENLFGNCRVDGFFLEYDTERAGGFEPLRFIKDQTVVLGLITSKFPELEDKQAIKARIQEASKYVPLERLCLSPQCGFSSTEEGNIMTEYEERFSQEGHPIHYLTAYDISRPDPEDVPCSAKNACAGK